MFSRQGRVRRGEEAIWGNGNSRHKDREGGASTGCWRSSQQCLLRAQKALGEETGSEPVEVNWVQSRKELVCHHIGLALILDMTDPWKDAKQGNYMTKFPGLKGPSHGRLRGRRDGRWRAWQNLQESRQQTRRAPQGQCPRDMEEAT